MNFQSKGTGSINFASQGGSANSGHQSLQILGGATVVNYLTINGGVASSPAVIGADGSDTNIDLRLSPKGTGAVQLPSVTTGTPVASICIDASNKIVKKTTSGACI